MLKTALGTVERLLVFNNLRIVAYLPEALLVIANAAAASGQVPSQPASLRRVRQALVAGPLPLYNQPISGKVIRDPEHSTVLDSKTRISA